MRQWMDSALSKYKDSDFGLRLKARFFVGVCLFNMAMVLILIGSILFLNSNGLRFIKPSLFPMFLCFFLVPCALALLIRGHFGLSAHLIVIINQVTIWAVIILDKNHPVTRLDTFAYVFCVLILLPLVVNRKKSVFLIYGLANILFLFGYMTITRSSLPIPDHAVIDFLRDNTAAILIVSVISYSVFAINRTALEKARAEIEERTQAEATVKAQKEKMEVINLELTEALRKMEQTARDLKAANERHEVTRNELVEANLLLRESEEKFSTVFHKSPLLIGLMDLQRGRFTDISDSLCRIIGYNTEEVTGRTSGELALWASQEEYGTIRRVFMSGDKLHGKEITIRDRQGHSHLLYLSSEIVSINKTPHIILMGVDITERRRAAEEKSQLENQLRQAQKMEAVGHLAGGIAHDFNNMLSVVMGSTDLLMMDDHLSEPSRKRVKNIRDASERSAGLVRQLLAFARRQTIRPRGLDINRTISGMLDMVQHLIGEDIRLRWIPGQDIGPVLMDPSQLDQVLANLMVNARDAIGNGGEITIETQRVVVGESHGTGKTDVYPGTFTVLCVTDNGRGMDKQTLDQIFEPFFTTKEIGKGTGLGLATVYGIVKQNSGFITVTSMPGQGSTFKLHFPEARTIDIHATAPPKSHEPSRGSGTILMVEDDPAILEIGESILEQLGYSVLTATCPETALDIARNHDGPIDLLLTDVVMPKMNGKVLSARISEIKPGIRCLYMSGYTANVIARHGVLEDGVMFLAKPFTVKDIADKVREAFSSPIPE